MKNILAVVIMLTSLVFANGFYDKGVLKGYTVEVKSKKTLTQGNNDISIKLSKDKKIVKNAIVRAKFFMPEMPGMPYMEYLGKTILDGDVYKTMVNFSMSGTWQYHIQFKHNGKKYRYRGSVNLGQASNMEHSGN